MSNTMQELSGSMVERVGLSSAHAFVVPIDSEKPNKPQGVTISDLLPCFPPEVRNKYKSLDKFAEKAQELTYFVAVTGEGYNIPQFGEGRSIKVRVSMEPEDGQKAKTVLLEAKGGGSRYIQALNALKPGIYHGFPNQDRSDLVFANDGDPRVHGAENKVMGHLALINGAALGLWYMHQNDIPLTAGLIEGGVTLPLAFRESAEITALVSALPGYVSLGQPDDEYGIIVLAAASESRQDRERLSRPYQMRIRAKCMRYLLDCQAFFCIGSAHPQQIGGSPHAFLPLFDFGDIEFLADFPEAIKLQNSDGSFKEFSQKELWEYHLVKSLNAQLESYDRDDPGVHDGLFPTYSLPGSYSVDAVSSWHRGINTFFDELLYEKLSAEQVNRLASLYIYFPKEVTYLVARLFAQTEALPDALAVAKIRANMLDMPELQYLKEDFELVDIEEGLNATQLASLTTDIANSEIFRQVNNYVLTGEVSNKIKGTDNLFGGIVSLIERVNNMRLGRSNEGVPDVYTIVRSLLYTVRTGFDMEKLKVLQEKEFKEMSDKEMYLFLRVLD